MSRHLVHIGYHKSATTWFQQDVYPRVENLRYVDREQVRRAFLDDSALHWRAETARRILQLDVGDRLILCEEGLSGYLHNGGLFGYLSKEMAHRLQAAMPESDVVVFIRRQPDMVAACYAQYIRGGGTYSVDRYLWPRRYLSHGAESRYDKIPRFSFDHFEYLPLLRHYRALFGAERLHVFPFEALKADSVGFLADFASRFDLRIDPESPGRGRRNVSYRLWLMPVARVLNLFTRRTVLDKHYLVHIPYWYTTRRWMLERLNRIPLGRAPSPARLLGPRNMDYIQQRYGESNRQLAEEFALPLETYDYPL
ncbi:MAG TPA: hypothetical protein VK973_16485 [Arenicellales bacterium]|nr:hypothetical protein [Arenicellales bacterium]